ncbi:MAG: acyl-CoA dehydrogenase family protein [Candidatus Binataceae bacterium]|jgi:alkylation response protein AidB-like acyl-CoA dehydrogenase
MVSFELSEEQRMIRDMVAAFARDEIRPAARPADETGSIPEALIAKSWDLGLVSGPIPSELGGLEIQRSAVTGAVVAEELAFGDLAIALHVLAPRLIAYPVLEMGGGEQHKRYLPTFAGERFAPAAAAIMEPLFDFDLGDMSTKARRDGSGYVLNGRKCCVPLARESRDILVYAAAEGASGLGGVDGFMIARDTPGATLSEREKNMGIKALATYELELKDCRVGAEARLGGSSGKKLNFSRLMSEARVAIAAMGVGVARAAYEYARDYAKERKAFGTPIATRQAIAFILAEMAIEVDASRLMVWQAAAALDKGDDALKQSYLAKNYVAAAALKITDNAVQVLGGHGYIREHPVEMWLRNARGLSSFEGIATV